MKSFDASPRNSKAADRGGSVKTRESRSKAPTPGLLGLQQTYGNRAVGILIQRALSQQRQQQAIAKPSRQSGETTDSQSDSGGFATIASDSAISDRSGSRSESDAESQSPQVIDQTSETPEGIANGTVARAARNSVDATGDIAAASDIAPKKAVGGGKNGVAEAMTPGKVAGPKPGPKVGVSDPLIALSALSASEIARGLGTLGTSIALDFDSERTKTSENAPVLKAHLPGSNATSKVRPKGEVQAATLPKSDSVALTDNKEVDAVSVQESEVPAQPDGNLVRASAGTRPQARMEGNANPGQLDDVVNRAHDVSGKTHQIFSDQIVELTAKAEIHHKGVDHTERIKVVKSSAKPSANQSPEMLEYLGVDVPPNVRAIADARFAPVLEKSLANSRQQAIQAIQQRDDDRNQALVDAKSQTELASGQAHSDREKALKTAYEQIAAVKQKGLAQTNKKIDAFHADLKQHHADHHEQIQNKVAHEQERADNEIEQGEEKAKKAQQDAVAEQQQKTDEAERNHPKNSNRNVIERADDWFVEAVKKWKDELVNAIKLVFETAKKVVTTFLTAAKNMAVSIIRDLRNVVVGMIQAFAGLAKQLVDVLLVEFPKIRASIETAIDQVVSISTTIVDAVASKLETAVTTIADKVSAVVTKLLDVFELAIVTEIQVVGALLTGDFQDAAKIMFLAACQFAGIPGEEFLSILADARDSLLDIIKHPGQFLSNLLRAVAEGTHLFFVNFPQRLKSGLISWLFGQVAAAGVELPKTFDLKSIFKLLMEVMGFTYGYIRSRVVQLVGERAVETVEKVMTPIKLMFTEGPGAVWNWIADQAQQVKEAVIATVSEWIVTKIITQAAIKLASMFTPVGAFVQAVMTMYNTITFYLEKMNEIFEWVKSVTSSLKTIAVGAIGAAAQFIDQSMSKTIPLIIDFLARLIGVDGIAEKIQAIVATLRKPVDKAIDFLIGKLIQLGTRAWGAVKSGAQSTIDKVTEWWNAKAQFTSSDGEQHTLYFAGQGDAAELTIASTPNIFKNYLNELEKSGVNAAIITDLRNRHQAVRRMASQRSRATDKTALDKKIQSALFSIARILREIPVSLRQKASGAAKQTKDDRSRRNSPDDLVKDTTTKEAANIASSTTKPLTGAVEGTLGRDVGLVLNEQIVGGVPEGYAGHHLISIHLAENSIAMKRAAELNYNINRGSNGISLPTVLSESQATGFPIHTGRHLSIRHVGSADAFVKAKLDALDVRVSQKTIDDPTLLNEIAKIEDATRLALKTNQVRLQLNDPHWKPQK